MAGMLNARGPAIPQDAIVVEELDDGETVLLITNGGVLRGDYVLNPMIHIYLTNRRVLIVGDQEVEVAGKRVGYSAVPWTANTAVSMDDKKYGPNRVVRINSDIGFVMPKSEAKMFLLLAERAIGSLGR